MARHDPVEWPRFGAVARPLGRAFVASVINALPNGRATAPFKHTPALTVRLLPRSSRVYNARDFPVTSRDFNSTKSRQRKKLNARARDGFTGTLSHYPAAGAGWY